MEKEEGASGRKRGTCAWRRVDGVQRMQRQTWKTGRLLTSHSDTDNVERERREGRLTLGCFLHQQNGCSLTLTNYPLQNHFSITFLRRENVNDLIIHIQDFSSTPMFIMRSSNESLRKISAADSNIPTIASLLIPALTANL